MFRLLHTNEECIPKVEFFMGKLGEVFLYGEALTFEQNRLTKCTEGKKPLFICLNDTSCKRKSKRVSVLRISKNYLFECPIDEKSDPIKEGDLVRLSDDARAVVNGEGGIIDVVNVGVGKAEVRFNSEFGMRNNI